MEKNTQPPKLHEPSDQNLSPEQRAAFEAECHGDPTHRPFAVRPPEPSLGPFANLYAANDLSMLQAMSAPRASYTTHIRTLDELLERDRQREKDGFPRKIQVGRLIKPQQGRPGSRGRSGSRA